jgi:hypothetical protein
MLPRRVLVGAMHLTDKGTLSVDGDHPWQLDKRLRDAGPGPAHIRFATSKPV